MTSSLFAPVRALLLAVALVFAAQVADARSATTEPVATRSTARSAGDAVPPAPNGVQVDGVVIIVGVVGVVILLAWVCSRVSDTR